MCNTVIHIYIYHITLGYILSIVLYAKGYEQREINMMEIQSNIKTSPFFHHISPNEDELEELKKETLRLLLERELLAENSSEA